jgi:ATP-dependent helicase/nuclease subunit A
LANLGKIRRVVRELGPIGPAAAYGELVRRRELLSAEAMAPLVGPADDVVVLTTIHQAKGLEWPIVCLPNLQSPPGGSRAAFSDRHGVLLCKAIDANDEQVAPLSVRPIVAEAKASAEAEERRLLYVALTRARERLILSASVTESQLAPNEKSAFTPLSFLLLNTGGELIGTGEHDCGAYRTTVREVHDTPPVTSFASGAALRATLRPRTIDAPAVDPPVPVPLPLSLKVTELLSYRRCPQVYRFAHDLEIEEHVPRRAVTRSGDAHAPSGVELGTIVHGLLERARFVAADPALEVDRLLADEPPEQHDQLRRMLIPVLSGEIAGLARRARRLEREWPFATIIDGVMIEGVIDLAIQREDGGWTIVDYKSNDLSRIGRFEYLRDYYMPQLELYSLALSQAQLGEVTEKVLVFLDGYHVVRQHFDAGADSTDTWPRDAIAAISSGNYATTAGPKCEQCGYQRRHICDVGRAWAPERASAGVQRPSIADVDPGRPHST